MYKLVLITFLVAGQQQPLPVSEFHHPHAFGDKESCESFAKDDFGLETGWIVRNRDGFNVNYECRIANAA